MSATNLLPNYTTSGNSSAKSKSLAAIPPVAAHALARLLVDLPPLSSAPLPAPWGSIAGRLSALDADRREKALLAELNAMPGDVDGTLRAILAVDPHTLPPAVASDWEPPVPFHHSVLPAFPTQALSGWLRAFVEAEAEATQTPPDLAAMLGLTTCAACVAKRVVILIRAGFHEPLNVFTQTVLAPGNRKSAVFRSMTAPLQAAEEKAAADLAVSIAQAESEWKILEGRRTFLEAQAAKATTAADRSKFTSEAANAARQAQEHRIPVRPRYIADDCTPEKTASLLAEQGGRLAVLAPEGDLFELLSGRYRSGTSNFGVYLRGHAGDDLHVDRSSRPPEYVKEPALTVGLTVQPSVLRGLASKKEFRGRGLLARFLYAIPVSLLGNRRVDPPAVPAAVRSAYHQNVAALLALTPDTDGSGAPAPHILRLAPEAATTFRTFEQEVERQLSEFGELGSMADWGGKLVGAVARITGILHLADHAGQPQPWSLPVPAATVDRAITIGRYLTAHARAAFAEMGADPEVEDAQHIVRWLQRSGQATITKRDLFQGTKGRFKKVTALEGPLLLLLEHGYLREVERADRPGPGQKPSPSYEVNPALPPSHNSHNSHNPQNPSGGK